MSDLDDVIQREVEESKTTKEYTNLLRAGAKPLKELLVQKRFIVVSYLGVDVAQREFSEHAGDAGRVTGYIPTLEITVKPLEGDDSLVRTLLFHGHANVSSRDLVRATIPCYQKVPLKSEIPGVFVENLEGIYLPRKLGEREEAIQLEFFDGTDVRVVGTRRSVNYELYQK